MLSYCWIVSCDTWLFFKMQVEQVKLLDRFSTNIKSQTGTLYLTATHLLFIDSSQKETWVRRIRFYAAFLYLYIFLHYVTSKKHMGWCTQLFKSALWHLCYNSKGCPNHGSWVCNNCLVHIFIRFVLKIIFIRFFCASLPPYYSVYLKNFKL